MMPIGKYKNWDECKADGKSDEYCGWLEHHTREGHNPQLNNQDRDNLVYRKFQDLTTKGVPDIEIQRALMNEFAYGRQFSDPWPPRITGMDQYPEISTSIIPASSYPPYDGITANHQLTGIDRIATPTALSSPQWLGTASTTIGPPPLHGLEPSINSRQTPEESWFPRTLQMANQLILQQETEQPQWARYKYNASENCPICASFDGKIFDLSTISNRPVLPSEHVMYTTQHPNCACTWEMVGPITPQDAGTYQMSDSEKTHVSTVNRIVGQKSRYNSLHPLNSDGTVSDSYLSFNPRKMMEAISNLHQEFKWLTPEYVSAVKQKQYPGKMYLVRAAAETITDHRVEGEKYKRKLDGMELVKMARTGIGKATDINHNPEFKVESVILDGEGDEKRKEIQFLVLVLDKDIAKYIDNRDISAVSINGGVPRSYNLGPCEHSCTATECEVCSHPTGVVLGETDNIAFTWVVTNPKGILWKGQRIPAAEPGVKTTLIKPL